MNRRTTVLTLATAGMLLAGAALTGCSVIDELAYQRTSTTYDSAAAQREGGPAAAWVPADATEIQITRTTRTDAGDATMLLRSAESLDPDLCVEVTRQSAPQYVLEDAPEVWKTKTVFACGEWSVMATDDGWLGWTPNHPDEAAQSIAAG